ncbi:MAG TPA: hypothetical protein VFQ19_07235 [Nocardioidaceae bacterium]|nr:hypothetical protein [Nocardioidaceae bacterium]
MSRVVYIHVGAPKTGTTYLQDRLALNRSALAEHGIHYPALSARDVDHFRPALDLMGADWGGPSGHADGQWDALVKKVRRLDGTVIISHEILSAAPADKVARAMRDLEDSEVHVVYSSRDLARQIPATWQESIKQRRRWSYSRYLKKLQAQPDAFFWRSQGLPGVLGRWSAGLPPEQVHVVTVPPAGASQDLLFHRLCKVFGIDPEWAPAASERDNPSMGVAETAVVRQLNRRLHRSELTSDEHAALVKNLLVHDTLARRPDPNRATLPPRLYPWANRVAEEWVEWIEGSGIDVVGDVEELRPVPPPEDQEWLNPDRPGRKQTLDAALEALAVMTQEAARRPDPEQQLTGKVSKAMKSIRGQ